MVHKFRRANCSTFLEAHLILSLSLCLSLLPRRMPRFPHILWHLRPEDLDVLTFLISGFRLSPTGKRDGDWVSQFAEEAWWFHWQMSAWSVLTLQAPQVLPLPLLPLAPQEWLAAEGRPYAHTERTVRRTHQQSKQSTPLRLPLPFTTTMSTAATNSWVPQQFALNGRTTELGNVTTKMTST